MEDLKNSILSFLKVRSHSVNSLHQRISYVDTTELTLALEELEKEKKIIKIPAEADNVMSEERYKIME